MACLSAAGSGKHVINPGKVCTCDCSQPTRRERTSDDRTDDRTDESCTYYSLHCKYMCQIDTTD